MDNKANRCIIVETVFGFWRKKFTYIVGRRSFTDEMLADNRYFLLSSQNRSLLPLGIATYLQNILSDSRHLAEEEECKETSYASEGAKGKTPITQVLAHIRPRNPMYQVYSVSCLKLHRENYVAEWEKKRTVS